jgi:tetratricopeptide (TPR) repeat protein
VRLGWAALPLAAVLALGQTSPPPPGESFEQLSARARQAYEASRPAEAIGLFDRALKLRPEWAEGWWAVGMLHYEGDRYAECRDALARMTKLDPSAAAGWALLGLCEFRTRQYDGSFEHLKRAHMMVLQGTGSDFKAIADYHLALLLNRQGAFEVSQAVLISVAPLMRSNTEMMLGGGLACLRMPILPEEIPAANREVVSLAGRVLWDLATKPPADTESDFATLLARYPSFPNVHYLYATYLAAHHPEAAEREFLAELKVSPDSIPSKVGLVLRYLNEQRLDEALRLARQAVAASSDSVGTQLALGKILHARGEEKAALAAFLEAKRLDPASPEIRFNLVTSYRLLGMVGPMRQEQAEYTRLKAEQKNWP